MARDKANHACRKEYHKRYGVEYRAKHPDRVKDHNANYRAANPEKAKADQQEWFQANKEKRNAYMREWHAKNKEVNREVKRAKRLNGTYKRKYGITLDDYNAMLAAQGGHCALCEKTPEDEKRFKRLNVDHCHETGRVRGILCTRCNFAIGILGDNEAGLSAALRYIRHGYALPVARKAA